MRTAIPFVLLGILFLEVVLLSGCGSFSKNDIPLMGSPQTRYSDTPQMLVSDKKKYHHVTKQQIEQESELHSQAGSLWVNEGQNSYLFAQNKTRREGDQLNIKLEGAGLKQVETKATVINSLLKQIEEAEKAKRAANDPAPLADAAGADKDKARAPASEKKPDDKVDLAQVQVVQGKLVERLADGNYRVKAAQPFTINKKEFKVIVTGLLRPEDFSEEGVSSNKLLDPQYDVVTLRRNGSDETDVL